MNRERRKALNEQIEILRQVSSVIAEIANEERESAENLQEKFPDRAEDMNEKAGDLEQAELRLDGIIDEIATVVGDIEAVVEG